MARNPFAEPRECLEEAQLVRDALRGTRATGVDVRYAHTRREWYPLTSLPPAEWNHYGTEEQEVEVTVTFKVTLSRAFP